MIDAKYYDADFEAIDEEIREICEYLNADEYDAAKEIADELIEEYEGIWIEDENERFFCFDSPLQYYIYDFKLKPSKMIKRAEIDYRTLHLCNGHIYAAYEEYEKAEEELRKALIWNPVDCNIFIELARIYRKTKEWNKFLIVIKAMQSYILSADSLAKYRSEIGMYYLEKEEYEIAAAMFYSSESVKENVVAAEGVEIIMEKTGQTPVAGGIEEITDALKKDGIEFGLDPEILSLIYDLSFELQSRNNIKGAELCLKVLFELTEDPKYERELKFLE